MTDLPPSNPGLIADLFAKDPLHLTREDRAEMVAYFRKNRALWVQGGKGTKPATAAAKKSAPPAGGLSLDDLEL
jgi:hypothetical protein